MSQSYPRHIHFESVPNFRDLGGYRTQDGRTVAWRRLFRSAALHKMNDRDIARLKQEISPRAVIDLRSRKDPEKDREGLLLKEVGARHDPIPFRPDSPSYVKDEAKALLPTGSRPRGPSLVVGRPALECAFEGSHTVIGRRREPNVLSSYLASSLARLGAFRPLAPPVGSNIQPSFCDRLRRNWNRAEIDTVRRVAANGSKAAADALQNNARGVASRRDEENHTGSNELGQELWRASPEDPSCSHWRDRVYADAKVLHFSSDAEHETDLRHFPHTVSREPGRGTVQRHGPA
jgi:Tyrosine phosphatase family